jgi:hypothetical protein
LIIKRKSKAKVLQKLKQLREAWEFTPQKKQERAEAFNLLKRQITLLKEKVKLGTITDQEIKMVIDGSDMLKKIANSVKDSIWLLDQH